MIEIRRSEAFATSLKTKRCFRFDSVEPALRPLFFFSTVLYKGFLKRGAMSRLTQSLQNHSLERLPSSVTRAFVVLCSLSFFFFLSFFCFLPTCVYACCCNSIHQQHTCSSQQIFNGLLHLSNPIIPSHTVGDSHMRTPFLKIKSN